MDKEYLEEQYKIAVSDFKVARNENAQWDARKEMARLETLMTQLYGSEYCKEVHERYWGK